MMTLIVMINDGRVPADLISQADTGPGVENIGFKVLVLYVFLKNQKTSKGRFFDFLWVLYIVVFCINMHLNHTVIISLL